MSAGVEITLSASISAHGKDVDTLTLREPTTEDIIELGQPFLIIVGDGETGVQIQNKKVAQYIVRLAGIPMSSVKALARNDFSECQAKVLGFFGTDADGQAKS